MALRIAFLLALVTLLHRLLHFTDQAYPLLRVDVVLLFDLVHFLLQLIIDGLDDLAELLELGDGDLLLAQVARGLLLLAA